ncbi:uncharacterized protein MONBRDRAFT_23256 [Monosiga brevicollis MX1]|uniref:Uncharacterized protein n=1 Tax=Monosiga brevicollis TaxID=81824 RepID=A9URM5_MONBE|nr:uncharacterized protein MONBRDRAFT_23256 [Monosiga brevicollis MX1]EDQ91950.1 predicted protein [Monosiga brevicollis MX1]|eukprot:XP_001743236.1 hypothetical protein [Monosiga brevicollis MX1]
MSADGEQLSNASDPQNRIGQTPLHLACLYGHVKVEEMLLKHGADATAKDVVSTIGQTPLHLACLYGHVKVEEMLLKHGADAKAKSNVSTVPPSSPFPPMMVHLYHMMMMLMLMLCLCKMLMRRPTAW